VRRTNHTTLDGLRDMRKERAFGADGVKKIVVHGSQVTASHVGWKYVPQGLTSAQLNMPYCVATWLLEDDCFVDQFTEDKVADPARMALAEKVEVIHDPAITAKVLNSVICASRVYLKDGTKWNAPSNARGSERSLRRSRVVEKFEKLATRMCRGRRSKHCARRDAEAGRLDASELARLMQKR
jgi:2-methylcitrate dehydratase PrpD